MLMANKIGQGLLITLVIKNPRAPLRMVEVMLAMSWT